MQGSIGNEDRCADQADHGEALRNNIGFRHESSLAFGLGLIRDAGQRVSGQKDGGR